jgi:hypothetical protein
MKLNSLILAFVLVSLAFVTKAANDTGKNGTNGVEARPTRTYLTNFTYGCISNKTSCDSVGGFCSIQGICQCNKLYEGPLCATKVA